MSSINEQGWAKMKGTQVRRTVARQRTYFKEQTLFDESWERAGIANRILLMVKDDETVFAYWTIDETRKRLMEEHFQCAWRDLAFFLQLYDVTDILFDGQNAHSVRRLTVDADSDNWYIHNVAQRRNYIVDFGSLTLNGNFFTLLRSNVIEMPREMSYRNISEQVRFAPRFISQTTCEPTRGTDSVSNHVIGNTTRGTDAVAVNNHATSTITRGPQVHAHAPSYPYQEQFDGYTVRESEKVTHS